MLFILFAQLAAATKSHKFWIELDYDNTTQVDCSFSHDDFDCSVIHIWGTDKSKAVMGGVEYYQPSIKYYIYFMLKENICMILLYSIYHLIIL